jgi:G:T-mismatch repair DNA endonuclease (very short patch repair protein)
MERDRENYARLEKENWLVIVVWECDLKRDFNREMERLLVAILEMKSNPIIR